MTDRIRPSDGAVRHGRFLDMNVDRLQVGERVFYRRALGGHAAGEIESRHDNDFNIGIESVQPRRILGRVPETMTAEQTADIITRLNALEQQRDQARLAAYRAWERDEAALLKASGIR